MRRRDLVIALTGAIVIALAVGGLVEIGDRAGPYEVMLDAEPVVSAVHGSLQRSAATGTPGPGGTCVPEPPATACRAAATTLTLHVAGLPVLAPPAHYAAWWGSGTERIGTLETGVDGHALDVTTARDETARAAITIRAHADAAATGGPVLLTRTFAAGPGTTDLGGPASTLLAAATGQASLHEIGGFAISTTVKGTIDGLPQRPGWTYQAWLRGLAGADAPNVALGPVVPDADGRATIDVRIERLALEDVDRLVVTLVPAHAGAAGPGLPVAAAALGS